MIISNTSRSSFGITFMNGKTKDGIYSTSKNIGLQYPIALKVLTSLL